MAKKRTHEEFIIILNKINPNIEVLGEYKNNNTPILCRCLIDGYTWTPRPKHLLDGKGCPKCGKNKSSKSRTKTHDSFIKEFYKKFPNSKIEILGEYVGAEEYIECKCIECEYEWKITPHNLLKGKGCPKCAIKRRMGSNNCRYNPNITDEEREVGRNYSNYKEWRTKCFERDNYTCQVTGEKGTRLEVHHIYSYDNNKELRLDINNGITISKEIHKQFHSIYGYGNNTLEQWEEFIKSLK